MEAKLQRLTLKTCRVYLDDIAIKGITFEEYLQYIEVILKKFQETKLKLNSKKCSFFQKGVTRNT